MGDENPLTYLSQVTELNDLSEFMQDDVLDQALDKVVKLIAKPDVHPVAAGKLLVQLQAQSALLHTKATIYSTIHKDRAGTVNNNKKNIYFTVAEALDDLVQALKFLARA